MSQNKTNYLDFVSPIGRAVHPWLNTPDTKFNKTEYSVQLVFSKEDAKKMSDIILPLMNGGANNPLKPYLDDQKNPTGEYIAKFSLPAETRTHKGIWKRTPILRDPNGNRVVNANIGGGSMLEIAFQTNAYPKEAQGGGVKLLLVEVKIHKLEEYAPSIKWGETKGDYVAPAQEPEELEKVFSGENLDAEMF